MKEYKMPPKQIGLEQRKAWIKAAPLMLIAIVTGVYIGTRNAEYKDMPIILPLLILVIAFAAVIGIRRSNKLTRESLSSYKIELLDNSIKKYQKNTPVIEIQKAEVVSIIEAVNQGITITTNNSANNIYIPASVEGYSELKESLSEWMDITVKEKNNSQLINIVSSVGTLIALAVVLLCERLYIVIPVGIIMILGFLWTLVMIQKNPHLDTRVKKSSFILILPIAMILLRILALYFGWSNG